MSFSVFRQTRHLMKAWVDLLIANSGLLPELLDRTLRDGSCVYNANSTDLTNNFSLTQKFLDRCVTCENEPDSEDYKVISLVYDYMLFKLFFLQHRKHSVLVILVSYANIQRQIWQFLRKNLLFSKNGLQSAMRLPCHVTPLCWSGTLALLWLADSLFFRIWLAEDKLSKFFLIWTLA